MWRWVTHEVWDHFHGLMCEAQQCPNVEMSYVRVKNISVIPINHIGFEKTILLVAAYWQGNRVRVTLDLRNDCEWKNLMIFKLLFFIILNKKEQPGCCVEQKLASLLFSNIFTCPVDFQDGYICAPAYSFVTYQQKPHYTVTAIMFHASTGRWTRGTWMAGIGDSSAYTDLNLSYKPLWTSASPLSLSVSVYLSLSHQEWFLVYEHNRRPSCTVSDLVMGNEYFFRVFSENICGLSDSAGVSKNTAIITKTGNEIPAEHFAAGHDGVAFSCQEAWNARWAVGHSVFR